LDANRRRLGAIDRPVLGRPFQDVRRRARQEVLAAARAYLAAAGEPPPPAAAADVLVMAGHQPELFHPGVWLKNFALCGLARGHAGAAVNLIVDNDALKSAALRVPCLRLPLPPVAEGRPHTRPVPFDRVPLGIPHEEWVVQDEALFGSLPERARQGWGFAPLLDDFWAEARRQAPRTRRMA